MTITIAPTHASLDAGRDAATVAAVRRSALARIIAATVDVEDETKTLGGFHPDMPGAAADLAAALGKLRRALVAAAEEERVAERWVADGVKLTEHAAAMLLVHVGIAAAVEPSAVPVMTLAEVREILAFVKNDDEPIMGATRTFEPKDLAFLDYAIPLLGTPAERGIVAEALPQLFNDPAPVCAWVPVLHDDPAGVRFADMPEAEQHAVTGWFVPHGWDGDDIHAARWAPRLEDAGS